MFVVQIVTVFCKLIHEITFDFQAILEFMYNGEVNVSQEDLNSFLAVAEDLKVKGLTQNTAGDSNLNHSGVPASADLNRSIPSAVLAAGANRSKAPVTPAHNLNNKNGALPAAKRFKRDPSLVNVKEEASSNQVRVVINYFVLCCAQVNKINPATKLPYLIGKR